MLPAVRTRPGSANHPTLAHLTYPILALFLGACGAGERAAAPAVLVRDSAGIEIVTNSGAGAWGRGEGWRVEEAVTIGELEGPAEFTFNQVSSLAASPAGRLYVLDSGDNVVKAYTLEGEYLFTFGGAGKGPAEFQGAFRLALLGDTVVVYDYLTPKLAYFTADGELLRTERPELSIFFDGFPANLAPIPGGYAIVLMTGCTMPAPEDRRPAWKLMTLGPDGLVRDTVAVRTGLGLLAIYGDRFCTTAPAPAARNHHLTARPDGHIAHGDGDSYEIRISRLEVASPGSNLTAASQEVGAAATPESRLAAASREVGMRASPESSMAVSSEQSEGASRISPAAALEHPLRLIRRDTPPLPFTPAEVAAYRAEHTKPDESGNIDHDRVRALEAAWDTIVFPRTWPAFDDLHWDELGHLWARRGAPDTAPTRDWDIFDAEGTLLGSVAIPSGLTIHAISAGHVWGTIRDEFDVHYVKGYRILR